MGLLKQILLPAKVLGLVILLILMIIAIVEVFQEPRSLASYTAILGFVSAILIDGIAIVTEVSDNFMGERRASPSEVGTINVGSAFFTSIAISTIFLAVLTFCLTIDSDSSSLFGCGRWLALFIGSGISGSLYAILARQSGATHLTLKAGLVGLVTDMIVTLTYTGATTIQNYNVVLDGMNATPVNPLIFMSAFLILMGVVSVCNAIPGFLIGAISGRITLALLNAP